MKSLETQNRQKFIGKLELNLEKSPEKEPEKRNSKKIDISDLNIFTLNPCNIAPANFCKSCYQNSIFYGGVKSRRS